VSRADLIITLTESGGPTAIIKGPSGTLLSFGPVTVGDFSVSGQGNSNSPGTAALSQLLNSAIQVTNTDAKAGHTLTVMVTDVNFSLPKGPLTMVSSFGGASILNGPNQATFQGWADLTNTPTTAGATTAGAQAGPPVSGSSSYKTTDLSVSVPHVDNNLYALLSTTIFTVGASGQIQGTGNLSLTPTGAVPAPAALLLALTGLPCLGAGYLVRRRKNRL
jgi:hypothetical protein